MSLDATYCPKCGEKQTQFKHVRNVAMAESLHSKCFSLENNSKQRKKRRLKF